MRARLLDADGNEISEFYGYLPHWTISTPDVNIVRRPAHAVVLEVPTSFNVTANPTFSVTAEAGSSGVPTVGATGTLITSSSVDHLVADRVINENPLHIALAATDGTDPWDVRPIAYTGMATLGNLRTSSPASGVMSFSSANAMAFVPLAWNTTVQRVSLENTASATPTVHQPLTGLLKRPITIWIDENAGADQWPGTTLVAVMQSHLADANRAFSRNRVGVEFQLAGVYRITTAAPAAACESHFSVDGEAYSDLSGATFRSNANTDAIDVFVVAMDTETGKACKDTDASLGYEIFLNANYVLMNVLAHELGHVMLTPNDNDADHEGAAPMGLRNLMSQGDDDRGAIRRHHLSIGQACAMNTSKVITALRNAAMMPSLTGCPPLTTDIP